MSESPPTMTTRSSPSAQRVAVVTSLAALISVAVNAALVWLAKALDSSLQDYSHFRLYDYGTLTVVGVACAGLAWYYATSNLASPRATFFRIALGVTVVLWLPDGWLLLKHEPTRAVIFLIVMHVAVALITYNLLVFAAPVGPHDASVAAVAPARERRDETSADSAPAVPHVVWVAMMITVGVEFVVGLIGMLSVPFSRPSGWLTHRGEAIYLVHAALGGALGIAALAIAFHVSRQVSTHRVERIAAWSGLWGVFIGAIGGVLCVYHPIRLEGLALMFIGVSVAFFGYLMPMIDEAPATTSSTAPTAP